MAEHTLGEVATIIDCEHKTAPSAEPGEAYGYSVGTKSLKAGRIDYSSCKRVDRQAFAQWTKRGRPMAGDLILAREAPVGQVGYVDGQRPVCLGQRTVLIHANSASVDARYLHFLLLSPPLQRWMTSTSAGSTVPHLNIADIRNIPLGQLPPLEEQRRIVGVLGALDDLASAEVDMAFSSGKLWRALVARSITRGSPMQVPLSSMARFVNGRNFTKNASGTGRPVIRTPEVRNGPNPNTVLNDTDAAADHLAQRGDILFVWSGSLCVNRWAFEEALVNQHVFKVLPNEGVPDWLVFYAVERQMQWFLSLAADKATTMGHIQRRHLDAAVLIPSDIEIEQLEPLVRPLWDQELASRVDAGAATAARDELLPLLLSGRVRVGEVAA